MPFQNGRPAGGPVDVLTGFLNAEGEALGRPVGVAIDRHGALLVADDVGNRIWRVTAAEGASRWRAARLERLSGFARPRPRGSPEVACSAADVGPAGLSGRGPWRSVAASAAS